MTSASAAPASDDDAPVRVATYPNPHEAELARAVLVSQGIVSVVLHDHGQYFSAASWVQLHTARYDSSRAVELLERGPVQGVTSAGEPDDMESLRLQRRFMLARWFLYRAALICALTGLLSPLAVVPIGLALSSREEPRRAFGLAFFLQILTLMVSIAIFGLSGLIALVPLVAFYFAWMGAAPDYREQLAVSLFPGTRSVPIGDSWNVGHENREPVEQSIWILRHLGVFVLVVAVLWVLGQWLRGS